MAIMSDQRPVMKFTSYTVGGSTTTVFIYPDRIEWSRRGLKPPGGLTGAVLTAGLTLALPGRRDTNMLPIRMIQGVTTHRAGLSFTTVRVASAGDVTEFKVTKRLAEEIKATLLHLMNPPAPVVTRAPAAAPSVADELRKLADLRDAGVLTEAEFQAQKSRLVS